VAVQWNPSALAAICFAAVFAVLVGFVAVRIVGVDIVALGSAGGA
jgi:hypothetical protein